MLIRRCCANWRGWRGDRICLSCCWMDAADAAWLVVVGGGALAGWWTWWMCKTVGRGRRYQKTKPSFAIPNEHIIFIVAARKVRECCSYAKSRANTADGVVSAAVLSPRLGNNDVCECVRARVCVCACVVYTMCAFAHSAAGGGRIAFAFSRANQAHSTITFNK